MQKRYPVFAILIMLTITIPAKLLPEFSDHVVVAPSGLNLRAAPSLSSKVITAIPFRARVSVIGKNEQTTTVASVSGQWLQVSWKGTTGWAFSGFLKKYTSIADRQQLLHYLLPRYVGSVYDARNQFADDLKNEGGGYVSDSLILNIFRINKIVIYFLSEETGRYGPNNKYAIFTCRDIFVPPDEQTLWVSGMSELWIDGKQSNLTGILVRHGRLSGTEYPVIALWQVDTRLKQIKPLTLQGKKVVVRLQVP